MSAFIEELKRRNVVRVGIAYVVAAWLLLASERAVNRYDLEPIGILLDHRWAALDPVEMGLGPVHAMAPLLRDNDLDVGDVAYWEINEAFAAQVLPSAKHLGIPMDKLNVNGGSIALGHPFGMTGARITATLLNGLEDADRSIGLETMCVGGGQGMAAVIERL